MTPDDVTEAVYAQVHGQPADRTYSVAEVKQIVYPLITAYESARGDVKADRARIVAELVRTALDDDGWLSDAQSANLHIGLHGATVMFAGEGSIDIDHIADIATALEQGAGE